MFYVYILIYILKIGSGGKNWKLVGNLKILAQAVCLCETLVEKCISTGGSQVPARGKFIFIGHQRRTACRKGLQIACESI